VNEDVKKSLIVDYPTELKKTLREEANRFFKALLEGE
jgi:hypothetical protein